MVALARRRKRTRAGALSDRWTPLRAHAGQRRYWASHVRFNVCHSGRRGGKSEIAKRRCSRAAMLASKYPDSRYCLSAPTHQQAKRIFWQDLKKLIPKQFMVGRPSESELAVRLVNGSEVFVTGLDVPERIEGPPLDGIVLDEYGNMQANVWDEHVRPALSDRKGWADFIGVPEGRNHYWELTEEAKEDPEWEVHAWSSEEILDEAEIKSLQRRLDDLTYRQEVGGQFVSFGGQTYYAFEAARNAVAVRSCYDHERDLVFCFDFNVSPGVAAVIQELGADHTLSKQLGVDSVTCVIGETWIERGSNTPAICRALVRDWGSHQGRVLCYGDATGGASGTAKVDGSDWDLIREELRPTFGQRLAFRVKNQNPSVRTRVNAMNSRLCNKAGERRLLVDPSCKRVIRDLEGVRNTADGQIEKKKDPELTHISDALGYFVERAHPVRRHMIRSVAA